MSIQMVPANETYLRKTGTLARAAIGEQVVVDEKYLLLAISCMKDIFNEVYKGMMDVYGESEALEKILSIRRKVQMSA